MTEKASAKEGKLGKADYVHLHNHTHFSVLDGLSKIGPMVDQVKEMGMTSVAITDHGTMSGVIEFYKAAKEKEVKPIIGMETYIAARSHTDKDVSKDKPNYHLTLLAMNDQGYKNLMRLSSIANLDGFYYKPRIDFELLSQYNEGLIVLSGCIGGEVADAFRNGQDAIAETIAKRYKKVFKDRYYIEVQDHGHPDHPSKWTEQENVNQKLLKLGKKLDIPCVLTCDAHYLSHDDKEAHEILLCVQTGSYLSDTDRMSLADFDLHLTDPEEVIVRWGKSHPEVIKNTKLIADRCNVEIELGKILIPKFPVPGNSSEAEYLEKLVYNGLAVRYAGADPKHAADLSVAECSKILPENVIERVRYELEVIGAMGFQGYFLIIHDFIAWGRSQGIVFGPGRGSAAGSIVAYGLGITSLDPIKYDLLFERFLNPDRISMPDVDIDIMDTRRNEVIAYCAEKYGHDRVANIVTFGTMAARNAVRDVARVLQVPYAEADRLAKMIPPPVQGRHIPLKISLNEDADLKREYEVSPTAARVFDLAMKLEGTIRSHGVHAAGVVIAPDEIVKFAPLEMAQKGVVATQYAMGPIEELGLLKMDFLGLSNLTIIKNTLRIIKKVYGTDIDIDNLPLDDNKTFELFQKGDTTGVFQFESAGMKRYLKQLQPTMFEDIIAMNALYRPGPMQFIEDFISRKRGERKIVYPHDSMAGVLENTYGVLVYQEQVMQISKEVCGFSGGEADTLRKAIGKKKIDIMRKMRQRMIEGAKKVSGIDEPTMEKFWQQLEDFAAYCFNKSHSACYAMIAFQTAYLKAHYPAAFMAALMTSDYDDTERLAIEISECQKMGLPVLPPDINESFNEFAVILDNKNPAIRFGLTAIKNVGSNAVEEILRARENGGPFKSLEEFLIRVDYHAVNRKSLESLIKAGVFDRFHDRQLLLDSLDLIIAFAAKAQKQANSGQTDLFGNAITTDDVKVSLNLPPSVSERHITREQLMWERELLGLYLSQHPLNLYENILSEQAVALSELNQDMDGMSVQTGGIITAVREIMTKNGQKMAFVKIEDLSGETEAILFPSSYQQTLGLWEVDRVVLMRGKISAKDRDGVLSDEIKIMVDDAREITPEQAAAYQLTNKKAKVPKPRKKPANSVAMPGPGAKGVVDALKEKRLYIRLNDSDDQTLLMNLKQTIDEHKGNTEVVLVLGHEDNRQIIKLPSGIDTKTAGVDRLKAIMGQENIAFR